MKQDPGNCRVEWGYPCIKWYQSLTLFSLESDCFAEELKCIFLIIRSDMQHTQVSRLIACGDFCTDEF